MKDLNILNVERFLGPGVLELLLKILIVTDRHWPDSNSGVRCSQQSGLIRDK